MIHSNTMDHKGISDAKYKLWNDVSTSCDPIKQLPTSVERHNHDIPQQVIKHQGLKQLKRSNSNNQMVEN